MQKKKEKDLCTSNRQTNKLYDRTHEVVTESDLRLHMQ